MLTHYKNRGPIQPYSTSIMFRKLGEVSISDEVASAPWYDVIFHRRDRCIQLHRCTYVTVWHSVYTQYCKCSIGNIVIYWMTSLWAIPRPPTWSSLSHRKNDRPSPLPVGVDCDLCSSSRTMCSKSSTLPFLKTRYCSGTHLTAWNLLIYPYMAYWMPWCYIKFIVFSRCFKPSLAFQLGQSLNAQACSFHHHFTSTIQSHYVYNLRTLRE